MEKDNNACLGTAHSHSPKEQALNCSAARLAVEVRLTANTDRMRVWTRTLLQKASKRP